MVGGGDGNEKRGGEDFLFSSWLWVASSVGPSSRSFCPIPLPSLLTPSEGLI